MVGFGQADVIRSDRAMVKRFGFREFVHRAWPSIYPGKEYREEWYHLALYEELEDLCKGLDGHRELVVNLPPAVSKSTVCWQFFPAYYWIHHPHEGILEASYDLGLARRDAAKTKALVASQWFRERWSDVVRVDVDANGRRANSGDGMYANNRGGFRKSTTCPRGAATGQHPGLRGVDDPIKASAANPGNLATINAWWGETYATRGENLNTVKSLVTMQRLADGDLSSLLESLGFRMFVLPAEFDPDTAHPRDVRTVRGESLDSERLSTAVLAKQKITLGNKFAAQYNQAPSKSGGKIFDPDLFQYYDELPPLESFDFLILSLDCAFKDTAGSDYVCGGAIGVKGPDFFVLPRLFHDQLDFVDTCEQLVELNAAYPTIYTKLVEDKANGTAVMNVLDRKFPGLEPVNPLGGKETRAWAVSPVVRSRHLWLPRGAHWLPRFVDEVGGFPHRPNDDMVDMLSQGLAYLLDLGFGAESSAYVDFNMLRDCFSFGR